MCHWIIYYMLRSSYKENIVVFPMCQRNEYFIQRNFIEWIQFSCIKDSLHFTTQLIKNILGGDTIDTKLEIFVIIIFRTTLCQSISLML